MPVDDLDGAIRDWLEGQAAISAITGLRVYADVNLPGGYTPAAGPALLLASRGAAPLFPGSPKWSASIQFRSFAAGMGAARSLDATLRRVLLGPRGDGPDSGPIHTVSPEVVGQGLRDPETKTPFVLSFYSMTLHLTEA